MSGASSVEELEKIIRMAGFCDISIRTEPVSGAYEEKWGGELTVGQYILSAKVFARKPPQPCAETVNSACLCRQKLL